MINQIEKIDVSRKTYTDLETFQNMVLEWNNKFNLISKSSAEDIWNRHILDSLQLLKFISNKAEKLYDFGSGAGFPGMVLAIATKDIFPNLKVSLMESIRKKTTFLNEVKTKLNLDVDIYNERVENLELTKADIITSRAMASLEKLLNYAYPFCKKETELLFLKGKTWEDEIKTALIKWKFDYESFESITDKDGKILFIKNIRRK
jgi:16S rRNA (guanine527-N7)-methyltransferase